MIACHMQLALFSRLCNEVLTRRAAKKYDAESMMLAAKLLEQNPEVYTVWNYRREALAGVLKVLSIRIVTFPEKCILQLSLASCNAQPPPEHAMYNSCGYRNSA